MTAALKAAFIIILSGMLFGGCLGPLEVVRSEPAGALMALKPTMIEKDEAFSEVRVQPVWESTRSWSEDVEVRPAVSKPLPGTLMRHTVSKPKEKAEKFRAHSILVVGDSLSVGVGEALAELLKGKNEITVKKEGKVATGLTSAKYYDWEDKLRKLIRSERPDLVVVMIGGNDAHNGSGTSSWAEAYKLKVQNFLGIAAENDVLVFWAGLPPMGAPTFSERVKVANSVMHGVCASTQNCRYIDTWTITSGENNGFTRSKVWDGKEIILRAGDGAHFTGAGYRLLGRYILDQINQEKRLGL